MGDGPEYFYEHRVLPQDDKRVKHEVGESTVGLQTASVLPLR